MNFSAPFIATFVAATANTFAHADPASEKGASRSVASKSSKASGKSGKATVCTQEGRIIFDPDMPIAAPPVTFDFLSIDSVLGDVTLAGALYCPFFGLNEAAGCNAEDYATINFISVGETFYAEAAGENRLRFSASGGVFVQCLDGITTVLSNTVKQGLTTTYSLTCATPAVTKFKTKEGVPPDNICSLELGFQKAAELGLIFELKTTIALYDESAGVVCSE